MMTSTCKKPARNRLLVSSLMVHSEIYILLVVVVCPEFFVSVESHVSGTNE